MTNNDMRMGAIVLALDIIGHETYDKKFGYRHL